jgi:dipeptidyl aminopeptidase/acylaminoacyl peptidase
MKADLRGDPRYVEVKEQLRRVTEPGLGRLVEGTDVHASFDGRFVAIAGPVLEKLSGNADQRIGILNVETSELRLLGGPNEEISPRWSPVAETLAFLWDGERRGRFRLYLVPSPGAQPVLHAAELADPIETLAWSPDGTMILLQTAGAGADRAGAQGSGTLPSEAGGPDWLPEIEEAVPEELWRRLWLYRLADGSLRRVGPDDLTFWEIAWCGNDEILAVVSSEPRESGWYGAQFIALSLGGAVTTLHRPQYEIGLPAGSRDGRYAAIVDATASDRTVVAGDVLLFDRKSGGEARRVDTEAVDITCLGFVDERKMYFAGIRNLEVVAGEVDADSLALKTHWIHQGGALRRYPGVAPLGAGAFVTVAHAYDRPPAVVRVADGGERVLLDLADEGSAYVKATGGVIETVRWLGRDGLEIFGLLTHPETPGPYPLVVMVHGGPTSCYTNVWRMHRIAPFLAAHGYAVLHANPRGSSGRGQEFARMVRGDMNGEDTFDIIAGVEALAASGTIDPGRVAVTGTSYGGMMSSWIVTQTNIFAAAISISPVTDNASQHFTSNIPEFDRLFFKSEPTDFLGKHFSRSPVFFAGRAKTPTLNIAGAKDRCTPPTQAVEFHRALVENGVPSELVIYPLEGHGVRGFEATVDYYTRMLTWLEKYMPSRLSPRRDEPILLTR